jgi:hypothetical protein
MKYKDAEHHLYRNHGSFDRLRALIELRPEVQRRTWLRLLGEIWTSVDYPSRELMDFAGEDWWSETGLVSVFEAALWPGSGESRRCDLMMTPAERSAFEALPDPVTVYRGQAAGVLHGLSWSLDRDTAARFPFLPLHAQPKPALLTAKIDRRDIIAFKLDREEQEVIVVPTEVYSITEERLECSTDMRAAGGDSTWHIPDHWFTERLLDVCTP